MPHPSDTPKRYIIAFVLFAVVGYVAFARTHVPEVKHVSTFLVPTPPETNTTVPVAPEPQAISQHVTAPDPVHGIYITGWTAGTSRGLARTMQLFDNSVLNTVVIDIKDATGKLSYEPLDPMLVAEAVGTHRIRDLASVINEFHQKGVYVIGRLSVFQDPYYATRHPEDTFTDTRTGQSWTDYKKIAWLRPDSVSVRTYVEHIALDAYAQGFDEINVDYVRYPSDGELKYLDLGGIQKSKAETLQDFFIALNSTLTNAGIPLSADIFGLTMTAKDDVGIGQKVQLIAPSVGAVSPMVYPSHFWNGSYGIAIPAKEPYKVIHQSLTDGIAKLAAIGIGKEKLRPWFQDFDLVGVHYDASMVQAQITAAHDLGIESWLMWDPRNIYTKEVFIKTLPLAKASL